MGPMLSCLIRSTYAVNARQLNYVLAFQISAISVIEMRSIIDDSADCGNQFGSE